MLILVFRLWLRHIIQLLLHLLYRVWCAIISHVVLSDVIVLLVEPLSSHVVLKVLVEQEPEEGDGGEEASDLPKLLFEFGHAL
jgi:hypothetical protein